MQEAATPNGRNKHRPDFTYNNPQRENNMDAYEIANLQTRFMNAGLIGGGGGLGMMGMGQMPGNHHNPFFDGMHGLMGLPTERQSILSTLESQHMLNQPAADMAIGSLPFVSMGTTLTQQNLAHSHRSNPLSEESKDEEDQQLVNSSQGSSPLGSPRSSLAESNRNGL